MADSLFTITEESAMHNIVSIKVIGVGGGGTNMINHMIREGITNGIEIIASNTDAQHLATSLALQKIRLGEKLTKGLGAGMKPEVGRAAAEESYEQIKSSLKGADLVFIATGLGGGTGTGASSVVARAAKENGSLTIAVCTMPFEHESRKRVKVAAAGLEELKQECDSTIVIPNDNVMQIAAKDTGVGEAFATIDAVLARAVSAISSFALPKTNGSDCINTDFQDLKTAMEHKGQVLMGIGTAKGANAAQEALRLAVESPLLDNASIDGAMSVLVNFHIHPKYPITEVHRALAIVNGAVDEDGDPKFGISMDAAAAEDEVRVTLVATGLASSEPINNPMPTINEEELRQRRGQGANSPYIRKIAVGDIDNYAGTNLDVPTFIRRQVD